MAQFVTVYRGWYQRRTVLPYAGNGSQDTTNADDGVFAEATLLTSPRSAATATSPPSTCT